MQATVTSHLTHAGNGLCRAETKPAEPSHNCIEFDTGFSLPSQTSGTVVHCSAKEVERPDSHNRLTREWIAARLARLLGYEYLGEYEATNRYPGHVYFVPGDTLLGDDARELGIRSERDLFGGVVPHAFLTTKTIAHPLIEGGSSPHGWLHSFGSRLAETVLDGYTAFTREDARRAGRKILRAGDARVKQGEGIGGSGQTVVASSAELDAAIDTLDEAALARHGVVIEQNLQDVVTYSVGRVKVGDRMATYAGTQGLTTDNKGQEVYGGSDLAVASGDYDALLALDPPPEFRRAVQLARSFDAAISKAYPGLMASRRNYDIAEGRDSEGSLRTGVLEQSWRLGGASPAEIAALETFESNPGLAAVRATCVERYGDAVTVPTGAVVCYQGTDSRIGRITKYVQVEDHGRTR
jgi:hypothetical protein